jgi:predicted Zn-dependent protease
LYRQVEGDKTSLANAASIAKEWLTSRELMLVREDRTLQTYSAEEQKEWRTLWAKVNLLSHKQWAAQLQRLKAPPVAKEFHAARAEAHAQVDKQQWSQAAATYEEMFKAPTPGIDYSEVWFEWAAVRLLAGDREGYQQTCKAMLEARKKKSLRSFLVARACTLGPNSEIDVRQASEIRASELKGSPAPFWSLTVQGALLCRSGRFKEAVPPLEQSLRQEKRPGTCVSTASSL